MLVELLQGHLQAQVLGRRELIPAQAHHARPQGQREQQLPHGFTLVTLTLRRVCVDPQLMCQPAEPPTPGPCGLGTTSGRALGRGAGTGSGALQRFPWYSPGPSPPLPCPHCSQVQLRAALALSWVGAELAVVLRPALGAALLPPPALPWFSGPSSLTPVPRLLALWGPGP